MKWTSLLIILLLTSCMEEIELPHDNPRLVVEGYLNTNHEVAVKLSQTISKTDSTEVPGVSNATVMLADSNGDSYKLFNIGDGNYFTNVIPDLPGKPYQLAIEYEETTYSAVSMMPPLSLQLDSLVHTHVNDSLGNPFNSVLTIYYSNPLLANLYGLLMINVDSIDCCEGQLFNEVNPSQVSNQSSISLGQAVEKGRRIRLNVFQSDPFIYKIFNEQQFIRLGNGVGGLTVAPPINLDSNFDNDALGFFAAIRRDTASIVVR